VSILKKPATQPWNVRWGFETASNQIHKCIMPVKIISMFLAQIKEPLAHAKFGCKGNIILKMRLS
jgi:hypothetical protein